MRKHIPFTLATRLLATGQRLRADETASAATFTLRYAAQREEASAARKAGRR